MRNIIQLTSGIQEEGAPRNVLAQHHEKNRSNKPPELARLATAALHHATLGQDDELDQENDDEDQDQTQAACHDENQDHSRAARHSKSTGEVKPDTMAYYKGSPWWFILMQAKIKYRRHIALNHGFPDRDEHLSDARDILLEVIEEFKAENETLDQSLFRYFIYLHSLIISIRLPSSTRNGVFGTFNDVFKWLLIHSSSILDLQGRSHIPW
jgi:hypothetical protein